MGPGVVQAEIVRGALIAGWFAGIVRRQFAPLRPAADHAIKMKALVGAGPIGIISFLNLSSGAIIQSDTSQISPFKGLRFGVN